MPKEFHVTIGGGEQRLRFSWRQDAEPLHRRFNRSLFQLCRDALGPGTEFDPEARTALLFHGLHHDIPGLTEDRVGDWIQAHLDGGGDVGDDLVLPAVKAACYSGIVTGKSWDFEPGKAPGDPKTPETIPAEAPAVPAASS